MGNTKPRPKIVVIMGPTASGKSKLAVDLATKFKGEIISADSRQVYTGLDIGSGKITDREKKGIKHHLLDIANPKRVFTASQFQKKAQIAIDKIIARGKIPIITGGTGFYIDTILFNQTFPPVKPNLKLRQQLSNQATQELFAKLQKIDPERARTIDRNNKVRLIRALEITEALGYVPTISNKPNSNYDFLILGIKVEPTKLKNNIQKRLHQRLTQGMVDEVKKLQKNGLSHQRLYNLGLEYRYLSLYIKGHLTKKEMIETLNTEILHYAKRQLTWLKKYRNLYWVTSQAEARELVRNFITA